MQRQSAKDFDQELLNIFDVYVHGGMDRRGFLERAQKFAVGGATAAGLLAALSPDFARGEVVAANDERLLGETLEFTSPDGYGHGSGYLVRLAARSSEKLPGILVAHENRGLNPHIRDIARRLALEGYLVFAPDALAPLGGYPGDEDKARELFAQLDQRKTTEDFVAAAQVLRGRADCNGRLGAIGFCYGGGVVQMLATRVPELQAGVPFYGNVPPVSEAVKVKAPLLMHFASEDARINGQWPPYEAALRAAGVRITVYQYAGTQHGFNNDTTPRFDAPAAKLAWERTLQFFAQYLRA
jgi:carboxymethylenebutenolidase